MRGNFLEVILVKTVIGGCLTAIYWCSQKDLRAGLVSLSSCTAEKQTHVPVIVKSHFLRVFTVCLHLMNVQCENDHLWPHPILATVPFGRSASQRTRPCILTTLRRTRPIKFLKLHAAEDKLDNAVRGSIFGQKKKRANWDCSKDGDDGENIDFHHGGNFHR